MSNSVKPIVPSPSPPPINYLHRFVCWQTPPSTGWQQAMAYLALDLPEEAVRVLAKANPSPVEMGELAALWLLALEQSGEDSSLVAGTAIDALHRHGWHEPTFEIALIHCIEAGLLEEALALWDHFDDSGEIPHQPGLLHNLAILWAGREKDDTALGVIQYAALLSQEPAALLMDEDLADFWCRLAQKTPGSLACDHLLSEGVTRILDATKAGRVSRLVSRSAINRFLPEEVRPWMRREMGGAFMLKPEAPAEIWQAFKAWLDTRRHIKIKCLEQAIALARQQMAVCPHKTQAGAPLS